MIETMARIRWLIRADMGAVLRIENQSFPHPWTEQEFIDALRNRNVIGMSAVRERDGEDEILGYVIYELTAKGIEILNLAIDEDVRLSGLGRMILEKLKAKLSPGRRRYIKAFITEDNLDAHLFFKACGFTATAVKKDYCINGLDAYCFRFLASEENCCD